MRACIEGKECSAVTVLAGLVAKPIVPMDGASAMMGMIFAALFNMVATGHV